MSITVDTITHEILSDFFRHGRYLRNWGPRTVETDDLILSSAVGISLTKAGLTAHVVTLRERGLAMATVLSYRNAHRDLAALCHAAGVQRGQTNPHAFRHCFAVCYVRNGGDLYRLFAPSQRVRVIVNRVRVIAAGV